MASAPSLFIDNEHLSIATDLYQITMMAGYWALQPGRRATFELFARRLPANRGCLIVAGIEQAIHYLTNFRFTKEDIAFLKKQPALANTDEKFFDYLRNFAFRGDVFAVPEGTPIFPDEPIVRVTGSIMEAQLVESYLLSVINAQTLIASKAAKIIEAANGKPVFEFGLRRAHGPQAAIYACRAAYIAGFAGTSNVLAAKLLNLPVVGTMAHAWVMAGQNEEEALHEFRKLYPQATLLIDTYNTENGAVLACRTGEKLSGVRIDSGDLYQSSINVRQILDEAGQATTKIHASGDLNEVLIADLEKRKAAFDFYAVGTELMVSKDSPSLNIVYKLVSVTDKNGRWHPVAKKSSGKRTIGGAKQVHRKLDASGRFSGDIISLDDEDVPESRKLLQQIISDGELCQKLPSLDEIRQYCAKSRQELGSEFFKTGADYPKYSVELSPHLNNLQNQVLEAI
ncbi:MAG: nicotinate phosphoribosyltransferase [Candidatus Obscuribacterales bacterium]|nr:nicotinate phosphoribosyltransferase [Candidatus Obscuribacterales bacterium]